MSYQILLDLLYKQNRYQDVLQTLESIKSKFAKRQIGEEPPQYIGTFAFAACYKMVSISLLQYYHLQLQYHSVHSVIMIEHLDIFLTDYRIRQNPGLIPKASWEKIEPRYPPSRYNLQLDWR